jgi:hypothetical protein
LTFSKTPRAWKLEAAKSVAKGNDGWWRFDHVVADKARMKHMPIREVGVLDHVFVSGGLEWRIYARIVRNQSGAMVVCTFIRPHILTDGQFEKQLQGFEREIALWKNAPEGRRN